MSKTRDWKTSLPRSSRINNLEQLEHIIYTVDYNLNLAKLNYGQSKHSSFLRFPYNFWGGGGCYKLKPFFSPFQAIYNMFDFFTVDK